MYLPSHDGALHSLPFSPETWSTMPKLFYNFTQRINTTHLENVWYTPGPYSY